MPGWRQRSDKVASVRGHESCNLESISKHFASAPRTTKVKKNSSGLSLATQFSLAALLPPLASSANYLLSTASIATLDSGKLLPSSPRTIIFMRCLRAAFSDVRSATVGRAITLCRQFPLLMEAGSMEDATELERLRA